MGGEGEEGMRKEGGGGEGVGGGGGEEEVVGREGIRMKG